MTGIFSSRKGDTTPDSNDTGLTGGSHARASDTGHVPRTRAGSAWAGLGAATVLAATLVVFMAQNTGSVDVSFLWMTGSASLGLILLVGVIAAVVVTGVLGTLRILQLRRLVARHPGEQAHDHP